MWDAHNVCPTLSIVYWTVQQALAVVPCHIGLCARRVILAISTAPGFAHCPLGQHYTCRCPIIRRSNLEDFRRIDNLGNLKNGTAKHSSKHNLTSMSLRRMLTDRSWRAPYLCVFERSMSLSSDPLRYP